MSEEKQTTRLVIQLGDGAGSEQFAHTCGANTFGVQLTNNLGENTILDCDNPLDVPAMIIRHLESQDTSATISGTVATDAWPTWRAWADEGSKKNIKIFIDEPASRNGGHWIVAAFLQQLELNKQGSGIAQFTATISGSGRRAWTDA